jgi:hypothetical protein
VDVADSTAKGQNMSTTLTAVVESEGVWDDDDEINVDDESEDDQKNPSKKRRVEFPMPQIEETNWVELTNKWLSVLNTKNLAFQDTTDRIQVENPKNFEQLSKI